MSRVLTSYCRVTSTLQGCVELTNFAYTIYGKTFERETLMVGIENEDTQEDFHSKQLSSFNKYAYC